MVPIGGMFEAYTQALGPVFAGRAADVTEENIQARIRGSLLMAISNKFGSLLLTTGNKSELGVGYCTLYGDMCGGLAVISDVPKTLVYELVELCELALAADSAINHRQAAVGGVASRSERQRLASAYDVLDTILEDYVEENRAPRRLRQHTATVRTWCAKSLAWSTRANTNASRLRRDSRYRRRRLGLEGDIRSQPRWKYAREQLAISIWHLAKVRPTANCQLLRASSKGTMNLFIRIVFTAGLVVASLVLRRAECRRGQAQHSCPPSSFPAAMLLCPAKPRSMLPEEDVRLEPGAELEGRRHQALGSRRHLAGYRRLQYAARAAGYAHLYFAPTRSTRSPATGAVRRRSVRRRATELKEVNGPVAWSEGRAITIVEFGDLECPACKAAQPNITKLMEEEPKAKLIFSNYPLEQIHKWAMTGGEVCGLPGRARTTMRPGSSLLPSTTIRPKLPNRTLTRC